MKIRGSPLTKRNLVLLGAICLLLPVLFSSTLLADRVYIQLQNSNYWSPSLEPREVDPNNVDSFDAIMRSIPVPTPPTTTTIRIGSGVFPTRGLYNESPNLGFRLKSGWIIWGAGKLGGYTNGTGTTLLLKAVNSSYANAVIGAQALDHLDLFTLQDLEVDCNGVELTKIPGTNPPTFDDSKSWYIQGVSVYGTGNISVLRVG
jgi:hypothetical protein